MTPPGGIGPWRRGAALVAAVVVVALAAWALLQALAPAGHAVPVNRGGPLTAVSVDVAAGDVRIDAGGAAGAAGLEGRAHMRYFAIRPSLRVEDSGDGTLALTGTCRWWTTCTLDLELGIPPRAGIAVRTGFGDVRADGVGGDADLAAPSGSVEAHGLGAERVGARVGSGSVRLSFARAPHDVSVVAASGDVEIVLPAAAYRLAVETDAGRVTLEGVTHAPDAARRVRVETTSGDIILRLRT